MTETIFDRCQKCRDLYRVRWNATAATKRLCGKCEDEICAACDHDRAAHAENGMSDNAGRFGGACEMPDCPCKVYE